MKRCQRCKEHRPRDQFGNDRTRSDGLNSKCRACIRAIHHEKVARDPGYLGELRERTRRYRAANPEARRAAQRAGELLRLYGLTQDQHAEMLASQGGVCAICRNPESRSDRSVLSVDHDHTNGRVRGLLCDTCNTGLARFGDDPETLRAAADYLSCAFARRP